MIEEGLLLYQENACDFIIGFGGVVRLIRLKRLRNGDKSGENIGL